MLVGRTTSINDSIWSCLCRGSKERWCVKIVFYYRVFLEYGATLGDSIFSPTCGEKKSLSYLLFQIHFLNILYYFSIFKFFFYSFIPFKYYGVREGGIRL